MNGYQLKAIVQGRLVRMMLDIAAGRTSQQAVEAELQKVIIRAA